MPMVKLEKQDGTIPGAWFFCKLKPQRLREIPLKKAFQIDIVVPCRQACRRSAQITNLNFAGCDAVTDHSCPIRTCPQQGIGEY
jgi:hypothetical protein